MFDIAQRNKEWRTLESAPFRRNQFDRSNAVNVLVQTHLILGLIGDSFAGRRFEFSYRYLPTRSVSVVKSASKFDQIIGDRDNQATAIHCLKNLPKNPMIRPDIDHLSLLGSKRKNARDDAEKHECFHEEIGEG